MRKTLTYYLATAFDGNTAYGSDSILATCEAEARVMARNLQRLTNAPVTLYNGATNRIVARYGKRSGGTECA